MAEWHIILEMSNAVEVKDETSVQVYLDNRLAYDKGAVVSQVIGTQSPVIFKEPPAAKLLHGNGSTPLLTAGRNWMYPNGDGTMAAVIVDHAHPKILFNECRTKTSKFLYNALCGWNTAFVATEEAQRKYL